MKTIKQICNNVSFLSLFVSTILLSGCIGTSSQVKQQLIANGMNADDLCKTDIHKDDICLGISQKDADKLIKIKNENKVRLKAIQIANLDGMNQAVCEKLGGKYPKNNPNCYDLSTYFCHNKLLKGETESRYLN